MNGRRLHAASAVVAAAFMTAGCVSQGTYEKLEVDKNQEIAALQKQRGGLQEQVQGLQSQQADLRRQVDEQLFFDSGRADLKDTGKAVLKKVGEALKGYEDKVIRLVGHTDNVPIKTKVFPSNWELSVARATTVVRYLQEVGIPPERMIASGRAEYQPVAENDTPDGRKKNRRIEITLIDKNLVQEAGPGKK